MWKCVFVCVGEGAEELIFIKHLRGKMHCSERFKRNLLFTALGRSYHLAHFTAAEGKTQHASSFFKVTQLVNA